jgi:iron complex transport system substrate-binding protein
MLNLQQRVIGAIGLFLLVSAPALAIRELTDELGRHVSVPDDPQRIICLAPSLTETVYALGLGPAVVGITDYTEYPPEARTKPSVGGLTDPSIEKIVALHPDLVLAMREINRRETVDELANFAIPVFMIDPQGLEGVLQSIQRIGEAVDRNSSAEALVKRLREQRAGVAARVEGLARSKVLVLIWYDPVVTAGRKSFITDIISAAGGHSVTADIPQAWPQISLEEVLRRSPDFLLLVRGAHGGITAQELKAHAGWDRLKAVGENRVIYMDERLFHPSALAFDALKQLAKELHPEAFQSRRGQP